MISSLNNQNYYFKKVNNVIPFKANTVDETKKMYGTIASRVDKIELDLDMTSDKKLLAPSIKGMSLEDARDAIIVRLSEFSSKMQDLVYKDPMLKVPNRKAFDRDKIKSFLKVAAHSEPLGFISFDIDNFGGYNNAFGHHEGDKALKVFAETVEKVLGKKNTLYRIGGEEFVALLPGANLEEVGKIAERARAKIEKVTKQKTKDEYLPGPFTVSSGYSSLESEQVNPHVRELYTELKVNGNKEAKKEFRQIFNDTFVAMQNASDDALYISKLFKGRNSCTNTDELTENKVFEAVLSLGREFASVMRNSSQSVTEELVSKLKTFTEKN